MEQEEFDYTNLLDEITWLNILDNLDGDSLLELSSTCHKFREIIGQSRNLMKKIKFCINFPENSQEELKKIKKGLEICVKYLTRNYLNLQIKRLRDKILQRDMRDTFLSIVTKLGQTVTCLEVNNCYLLREDVITILHSFNNLVEMKLENIAFSDDWMPSEVVLLNQTEQAISCPNLKVLRLVQCDFYCLLLLKSHEKLNTLEISLASYSRPDVEQFENFLMKQSNLKDLKITHFRFNSTYSSERLAHVPFQLEKLHLKDVCWDIKSHCLSFLKSQNMLKVFELKRIRQWIMPKESNYLFFCEAMKHILIYNRIEKFVLDTSQSSAYLQDSEFLVDLCNNHVKHVTYIRDNTDNSELMTIFTRIFPNTQSFVFIDSPQESHTSSQDVVQNLHLFKHLKELNLTVKPASLVNFPTTTADNLISFYFYAINEEKSVEKIFQIFSNKPKIENFGLNIEPLTTEEIIELLLNFSSTLKTLSISDLHINATEAELFIRNFPNLSYLISDVSISKDVQNILKKNHITFYKCNGSKRN